MLGFALLTTNLLNTQTIPDTGFGQDMAWHGRIIFQLLAQMPHINPQVLITFGK